MSSQQIALNRGWEFLRLEDGGIAPYALIEGRDWEQVTLPHTARVEPADVVRHFQGVCWYRRRIAAEPDWKGKRIVLEFGAAMQVADVWVNGQHRLSHTGGYLPFRVDLSEDLTTGQAIMITVRLDNQGNADVPPGKPLSGLDFSYFGGLYRGAALHVTDRMHITDPATAGKSGGVLVRYPEVSTAAASVQVTTHVLNASAAVRTCCVVSTITDADGICVGRMQSPALSLRPGQDHTFERSAVLAHPRLWHPNHPHLYTLLTQVVEEDEVIDEQRQRIGIRSLRYDAKEGLILNGCRFTPRGTNRHQTYPCVGNAVSDNAQYRDAVKLKEAGFNLVRLAHYPQSPAFMDACDELGLMVVQCIPGWQHFSDTELFRQRVVQDLRGLIRRDRNRPSPLLWETTLNETGGHDEFLRTLVRIAHEECPGLLTCGDSEGHGDLGVDVPYGRWDPKGFTRPSGRGTDMSFHREYGDWEFGGNESTSRCQRGEGEAAMLLQAWNFQWSHNMNRSLPWTLGDANWVAIDYNRGYFPRPCYCGVLDPFRVPKFAYFFYQSQRNPTLHSCSFDSGPMVYIANYWMKRSSRKVVVYSNCQEVELLLNGRSLGRRKCDNGPDTAYGEVPRTADPNYWIESGGVLPGKEEPGNRNVATFDGGNCRHLEHPPFTFANLPWEAGELEARGYIDGKCMASSIRRTPGEAVALALSVDLSGRGLATDGDMVFVHAAVVDRAGTTLPGALVPVSFEITGPATLVGANPVVPDGGIASILLVSRAAAGDIQLTAHAPGLQAATLTITSGDDAADQASRPQAEPKPKRPSTPAEARV